MLTSLKCTTSRPDIREKIIIHAERPYNTNTKKDQCRGSNVDFPFSYRREPKAAVHIPGVDEGDEQANDIVEEYL